MKRLRLSIVPASLLAAFLFMGISGEQHVKQQTLQPQEYFRILTETTENGIRLRCEKGCAWTDLSFSMPPGVWQAVDQYGMTAVNRKRKPNEELANFLFTIRKKGNGLELKGLEGTGWLELSYTCGEQPCRQYINERGMAR